MSPFSHPTNSAYEYLPVLGEVDGPPLNEISTLVHYTEAMLTARKELKVYDPVLDPNFSTSPSVSPLIPYVPVVGKPCPRVIRKKLRVETKGHRERFVVEVQPPSPQRTAIAWESQRQSLAALDVLGRKGLALGNHRTKGLEGLRRIQHGIRTIDDPPYPGAPVSGRVIRDKDPPPRKRPTVETRSSPQDSTLEAQL